MRRTGLRQVYVLGVGQTRFTKQPQFTAEELGTLAARRAIEDAGIDPKILEVAFAGRIEDASTTSQSIVQHFGLQQIECINVENACSTGSTAVHCLWKDIALGAYDIGIAIGVESLSRSRIAGKLVPAAKGSYNDQIGHTAVSGMGHIAHRLMETRGCTMEDLAYAAYKNHKAAVFNPYAHYRKELSIEEIVNSEMIASPITKLMCCPNSDGAAAVILCTKEIAQRYTTQLVRFNTSWMSSGYFTGDTCEVNPEFGLAKTCKEVYEETGVGPMDLNCIEMHDAYSPEEIVSYEQMLLCPPFESAKLIRSGDLEMGGRCPVNLSGGMLSQGHPLGASGARVVCDVTRQLRGQAPVEVQIATRRAGLVQMVGGGRAGRSSEAVHVGLLTI